MRPNSLILLACLFALPIGGCDPKPAHPAGSVIVLDGSLDGWREGAFHGKQPTVYSTGSFDGRKAIRAESEGQVSSLGRSIKVDLESTPILEFEIAPGEIVAPKASDLQRQQDFAIRLYLVFADPAEPKRRLQLCYVWSANKSVDEISRSAYSATRYVVVGSGPVPPDVLQTIRRDVPQDIQKVYGLTPKSLSEVVIMTDTDDTGGSVTSWYGGIRFLPGTTEVRRGG